MMPDKYLGLLSSLISGLVGVFGALGVLYLTNRHQHSMRKADMLRERGEELYSASVEWINDIFAHVMRRVLIMRGQITYNECLDSDIKANEKKKTPAVVLRLEMLVDVYFPNTRPEHDAVTKLRDEMNEIESCFKRRYASGLTDGSQFLPSYLQAQEKMIHAGDEFQKQILNEIRRIRFVGKN